MTRIPPLFGQLALRTHAKWGSGRVRLMAEGFARAPSSRIVFHPKTKTTCAFPKEARQPGGRSTRARDLR
jgi:hypothetical protein